MGSKCWACISSTKHGPKHRCGATLYQVKSEKTLKKKRKINADRFELHASVFAGVLAGTSPSRLGRVAWARRLAVVVRLPQRYEACCFIGQGKLLRQGFCWRSDFCQSQMELHNTFTLQVSWRFPSKAQEQRITHSERVVLFFFQSFWLFFHLWKLI